MRIIFLLLLAISYTFSITIERPNLGFTAQFSIDPVKKVQDHKDSYGTWRNYNYTAIDPTNKSTMVLIVKDYRAYSMDSLKTDEIVSITIDLLVKQMKAISIKSRKIESSLVSRGVEMLVSSGSKIIAECFWKNKILYLALSEEPAGHGGTCAEDFIKDFKIHKKDK